MLLPALAPAIMAIELLLDSKMITFCKVMDSWIISIWWWKQILNEKFEHTELTIRSRKLKDRLYNGLMQKDRKGP